jgi:hypothetical protein
MRAPRKPESREERQQRLLREAQLKRDDAAAEDAAVDRMIRRNIEERGP